MTFEDISSHPNARRRDFNSLPVQICGAWERTRSEDGKDMDFFPNIEAARQSYSDLPNPDGKTIDGTQCTRFFGPIPHVIEGQVVIRYETLAARLRCVGHDFVSVDDYVDILRTKGDTEMIGETTG